MVDWFVYISSMAPRDFTGQFVALVFCIILIQTGFVNNLCNSQETIGLKKFVTMVSYTS